MSEAAARPGRRPAAVLLFLIAAAALSARPPVEGTQFSVVTRDPTATRIGFRVLEEGGTAADAAFAVAAALSVTEGYFSHVMGGGTWALYYDQAADAVYALDGVGPTGSGAGPEVYRDPKSGNPAYGMHLANVPGAWDGWMLLLRRFGSRELPELLAPAIRLAEEGTPASPGMVSFIRQEERNIRTMPETRQVFLPGDRVPRPGQKILQPALAGTFREVGRVYRAAGGPVEGLERARDHFYRGPLARRIVEFSQRHGGSLELEDFAGFRAELREPISIDYRGIRVVQCPPNSQGITMLMALNILKGYDFSGWRPDSPEAVHRIVEATKLAHVDKHFYVGDPAFREVPVRDLLSEEHAGRQRSRIRPDRALSWPIEGGLGPAAYHTTTFQVVDRWGNAAAVTTSIGAQFLVAGDTGILINQRVANLHADGGLPNSLEPRKKVRHTINPYMAFREGKLFMLGGNTGFDTQPQGQIQQFLNVVEFGMDPQEAVSAPRYITHSFPASTWPHRVRDVLVLERGFPEALRRSLARKGHRLGETAIFGNANLTVIDPRTGVIRLGADPRGDNLGMAR